jgi:CRISPR-associated protein Cmr4
MNARLLFVHALSPLHAGTGQGVGVIDLPIAREKATNLPYLPGSSLKGTMRDALSGEINDDLRCKLFGPENDKAKEYAGSVQFSDQRLFLLPVRSLVGTFAWTTSPYILQRLLRDAESAGGTDAPTGVPRPATLGHCILTKETGVLSSDSVYLEDLDLNSDADADQRQLATTWATWIGQQVFPGTDAASDEWRKMLSARFCVVHDDAMSFLLETATEVTARIKLQDDTKTAQDGALWYEEALPTESILYGLVVATPVRRFEDELDNTRIFNAIAMLASYPMQFGGKATVGRGFCRMQMQQ